MNKNPNCETDYLKKVRRRTKSMGLVIGIVLMLLGLLLLFITYFHIGREAAFSDLNYDVSVLDNKVYISGNTVNSTDAVARIVFTEDDGIVNTSVYMAPKAFLNSSEFSEEYISVSNVREVRMNGLIIWEGGIEIGPIAAQLYGATNPYIGDMPSNGRIAQILGIYDQFGSYTNELQTSEEPYGWIVIPDYQIAAEEEKAARDIMTADSYVMLAAVGNLGYVTWEYRTEAGQQEYTVTAEEASAFAGHDIKLCADSPSTLQNLVQRLSIKWSGVRETMLLP